MIYLFITLRCFLHPLPTSPDPHLNQQKVHRWAHTHSHETYDCIYVCVGYTVEPPLTNILYSGHLIIQDKMLQSGLNLHYTLITLRNADTSLFRKADKFCGPGSTWTVQNLLNNVDAGRTLAQDCPTPLVDSSTGHYTNTGTHSSSLWLPFLAIVQQGKALERAFNGTSTHCHTYRKYTGNLRSRDTSLLRTL